MIVEHSEHEFIWNNFFVKKISLKKQEPLSVSWGKSEIIVLHQNKLLLFI